MLTVLFYKKHFSRINDTLIPFVIFACFGPRGMCPLILCWVLCLQITTEFQCFASCACRSEQILALFNVVPQIPLVWRYFHQEID